MVWVMEGHAPPLESTEKVLPSILSSLVTLSYITSRINWDLRNDLQWLAKTDNTWSYRIPSSVSAKGFSQNTSLPAAKLENNCFTIRLRLFRHLCSTMAWCVGVGVTTFKKLMKWKLWKKELELPSKSLSVQSWYFKDNDDHHHHEDEENVKKEVQTRTACTLWSSRPCCRSFGRRKVTEVERAHWSLTALHLVGTTLINILARGL